MWSVRTNSLNSIREWFYYCMFYNNTYSDLAGNHLIFQTPRNLVFNKTLLTENQMYWRPRPSCSNFSTWLFLLEKSFAYFFSISIHKNIWASFTHRLLFFKFIPRGCPNFSKLTSRLLLNSLCSLTARNGYEVIFRLQQHWNYAVQESQKSAQRTSC